MVPSSSIRFHRCARANARISVSSGRGFAGAQRPPSGAMITLRPPGMRMTAVLPSGFPLSPAALRRVSGPAARSRAQMHVCDRALTLFSLPNCMTSTRRFLQMAVWGHRRSHALGPAHTPDLPCYPGSAERDKREHFTNACSSVVSRPCCTELPATVVTVWNVLGSYCVLLQHGLASRNGANSLR